MPIASIDIYNATMYNITIVFDIYKDTYVAIEMIIRGGGRPYFLKSA